MKTFKHTLLAALALTAGVLQGCSPQTEQKAVQETAVFPAGKPLAQLQQEFMDLRFGMFIHFNIPTFSEQD